MPLSLSLIMCLMVRMEDTKKMTLYVYSIYFSDGSEWGDRDASTATILKKGAILETQ